MPVATVKVVGMRAGGRMHVVTQVSMSDPVLLLPEPTNPYDANAIAVYTMPAATMQDRDVAVSSAKDPDGVGHLAPVDRVAILDRQAGYIPADVAERLWLPEQGVVGWVSRIRWQPPDPDGARTAYVSSYGGYDDYSYGAAVFETPRTDPAGFDVTANLTYRE